MAFAEGASEMTYDPRTTTDIAADEAWAKIKESKRRMFTIKFKGRTYRYATLSAATKAASDIFALTGIVIGIEKE